MNTTTKFNLWTLVLIAVIAYAFFSAVDVFAAELFWNHESVTGSRATYTEKVWSVEHSDEPTPVILYACTYDANGNVIECVEVGSYIPGETPEL